MTGNRLKSAFQPSCLLVYKENGCSCSQTWPWAFSTSVTLHLHKPDGRLQQREKTKAGFSEWGPRSQPEGRKKDGLKAQILRVREGPSVVADL